jgi:DsbC/DsbD-like thiol-disulfide interchange protein
MGLKFPISAIAFLAALPFAFGGCARGTNGSLDHADGAERDSLTTAGSAAAAEGDAMNDPGDARDPGGADAMSPAADSLEGSRRVLPRLVLEAGALKPGERAELAVIFEIDEEWHLYWRNPGDSGLPPDVRLSLPAGVTAGSPRWPAPHRLVEADLILDYIFDDHLVLFYPLEVSEGVPIGDATIRADLSWLVCRDMCIPGARSIEATFPVTFDPVRPFLSLTDRTILEEARQRLPKHERPPGFASEWKGESLLLRVPGADGLTFYPYESESYVYPTDAKEKGEVEGGEMILTYPTDVHTVERIAGVLEVRHAGLASFFEISIPAPR